MEFMDAQYQTIQEPNGQKEEPIRGEQHYNDSNRFEVPELVFESQ
jgi:hypothetical protein